MHNSGDDIIENNGWRTVIAESKSKLSCKNGNIAIKNDEKEITVPISQIRNLIIGPDILSLSTKLIRELCDKNVNVIICDEKYEPLCTINGLQGNYCISGHIIEQAEWTDDIKSDVWRNIVVNKIENQIQLLKLSGKDVDGKLEEYLKSVQPNDVTNREGQAARMYFSALYGTDFMRQAPDNTNAALNYGYTILQSSFSRVIAIHGYHTSLGIKHCSRVNPFNLSCDLMEPFRPFVDKIVFENIEKNLDREYKMLFIEMLNSKIKYNNMKFEMADAIDKYCIDVFAILNGKDKNMPEVSFGR